MYGKNIPELDLEFVQDQNTQDIGYNCQLTIDVEEQYSKGDKPGNVRKPLFLTECSTHAPYVQGKYLQLSDCAQDEAFHHPSVWPVLWERSRKSQVDLLDFRLFRSAGRFSSLTSQVK
ncbi:hypothetical protein PoB_004369500 [Plakobranchus ocellatus]|uniref:Uncharacterized protein n=1 Tax=Plakobranchus ocellatus TaxID=259542 RepID=A0AAV4BDL4_9GAST|nr:hypothetical protein PoB_004369500 [Plakobranchus ocellatus]